MYILCAYREVVVTTFQAFITVARELIALK